VYNPDLAISGREGRVVFGGECYVGTVHADAARGMYPDPKPGLNIARQRFHGPSGIVTRLGPPDICQKASKTFLGLLDLCMSHDLLRSEGICYYQNGYREGPEVEVEHVVLGEGLGDAQCYGIEHCIWRKAVDAALDG
jgi:hypothetical protein